MCSHRDVFHDGIGVVGVSKGADIALLMATHSPKVCINSFLFYLQLIQLVNAILISV